MKDYNFIKFILLILILPFFFSFSTNNNNSKVFFIHFFQDGKKIEIENSTIFLRKAPFKMVVEFNQEMGVALNASFSINNYINMRDGKLLENIKGFDNIYEQKTDTARKFIVSDKSFSYWFFVSKENNNFDTHIIRNGKIVGITEFKSLYDIDKNKNIFLANINRKIYLSFVSYNTEKNGDKTEFQREIFKIQWLKDKDIKKKNKAKKSVKEKKEKNKK